MIRGNPKFQVHDYSSVDQAIGEPLPQPRMILIDTGLDDDDDDVALVGCAEIIDKVMAEVKPE